MSEIDDLKTEIAEDYEIGEYQRRDAHLDLRFIGITGGQWEDYLTESHGFNTNRARLEFDMLTDHVMSFTGEWTSNRAGVMFEPDDMKTRPEDAELLTGVYRGDFRENGGKQAQDNAIFEAAACGFGALRISEQYVDESDPENDQQEIVFRPQYNAASTVIFDGNAKDANKSDAQRVTVLTGYNERAFKDAFPGLNMVSAYDPSTGWYQWEYFDQKLIYVAERFEIVKSMEEISIWQNVLADEVRSYKESDMEKLAPELKALGWEHVRDRKIKLQHVEKSIFNGDEFVSKGKRIAGRYLPVIPFYGYRVFIGNKEHYWGLVRKGMDGNRVLNTMMSKLAESAASSGDDLPVLTQEEIDGHEGYWEDKTNLPYLTKNAVIDENGNKVKLPTDMLPASRVDPNTIASLESVSNYLQSKTGAMQDTIDPDLSGKAVNALLKKLQAPTQPIANNIKSSLEQMGRVYASKAGDLYTMPMMKKAIGENGEARMRQLNQISIEPQSANPININELSKKRFSVVADVGPQYETQREATVENLKDMIEALPDGSPLQGPAVAAWVDNIHGTGLKPLKDLNRKIMVLNGWAKPDNDEEEQMLMQARQAQQQGGQQEQLIQALTYQAVQEGRDKEAQAIGRAATARKDIAQSQKVQAETAQIIKEMNVTPQKLKYDPMTGALSADSILA